MADINLIPQEVKENEKVEQSQRKLQFFSVGFLLFSAVLTILTLAFFAMYSSKQEDLIAKVEESTAVIDSYKSQEELIVVVKDKATAADSLLQSRVNFSDFLKKFSALAPQGVFFTSIKVTDSNLTMSGKARSSADVASLASSFVSGSINSLSAGEDGAYTFTASATLVGAEALVPAIAPSTNSNSDDELEGEL